MFWCDKLLAGIEAPQVINDSKTPSGRAHVGALRGPLIHDAIYRTLQSKGVQVRYLFGVDDYDPLDEIPHGQGDHFERYLGAPLCNVPPPSGSEASDMAEFYISEFFGVFAELGIRPEFYRMREVYRSGRFNEVIDDILRHADVVREIYHRVNRAERPKDWFPFQVICENCGRIGTTVVRAYNGKTVAYECKTNLVKWAQGCGYKGETIPFNGGGKLPWKLEWCAKWRVFPVTIEGAGKDHSTKGGSREVSAACLRQIFNQNPPLNCPYDFFLVGGAKMSSSRGIGVTAREMADFLPPEILRFLLIRPLPLHPVNFEPSETHITKLFNEFDRYQRKYYVDVNIQTSDKRIYELSEVQPESSYWAPDFSFVCALVQMPHLDAVQEFAKRKGSCLTGTELIHASSRIRAARYWLDNYASEEEKIVIQLEMPARASELSNTQIIFLRRLGERLVDTPWQDDDLQAAVFDAARMTPIDQSLAFQALYRVFLDRHNGPKAGNLLSFMKQEFVLGRLAQLPVDLLAFWRETGIEPDEFERWLDGQSSSVAEISAQLVFASISGSTEPLELQVGLGVIEFRIILMDQKPQTKRVIFERFESFGTTFAEELKHFEFYAEEWVGDLRSRFRLAIPLVLSGGNYGTTKVERAQDHQFTI